MNAKHLSVNISILDTFDPPNTMNHENVQTQHKKTTQHRIQSGKFNENRRTDLFFVRSFVRFSPRNWENTCDGLMCVRICVSGMRKDKMKTRVASRGASRAGEKDTTSKSRSPYVYFKSFSIS